MTTMRYGLGYNKSGVLGVAGLLGSSGQSMLGLSLVPGYFTQTTTDYLSDGRFLAGDLTGSAVNTQAPAFAFDWLVGGNGLHVKFLDGMGMSYLPAGETGVWITRDGETWETLPPVLGDSGVTLRSNSSEWTMDQIESIRFSSGKFYIIVIAMTTRRLVTTEDFVSFELKGVIPSGGTYYGSNYSYLGSRTTGDFSINEATGEIILTDFMSGSPYYSADGISWTYFSVGRVTDTFTVGQYAYALKHDTMSGFNIRRLDTQFSPNASSVPTIGILQGMQSGSVTSVYLDGSSSLYSVSSYHIDKNANKLIVVINDSMSPKIVKSYDLNDLLNSSSIYAKDTYVSPIPSGWDHSIGMISAAGSSYLIEKTFNGNMAATYDIDIKEVSVADSGALVIELLNSMDNISNNNAFDIVIG